MENQFVALTEPASEGSQPCAHPAGHRPPSLVEADPPSGFTSRRHAGGIIGDLMTKAW